MPRPLRASFVLAAVLAGLVAAPSRAQREPVTGFLGKAIAHAGREHRYVCYVPAGERPAAGWPLVVFLHGMGECGDDGWLPTEVGLGSAIRRAPQRWPAVVLFPQKPDKDKQWADYEALVLAIVAATEKELPIDATRRTLTGLSQGGAGTWAIGARTRAMWQAFAPVCGYGEPDAVANGLAGAPVWAFHGEDDRAVAVAHSKKLVAAVAAAGAAQKAAIAPLLTLYPGVGHNSWDKAYRDEALAEWLLAREDVRMAVPYLADPSRLTRAVIFASTTVTEPAASFSSTETSASCKYDGVSMAWNWRRVRLQAVSGRGDESDREGVIAGKPGVEFLASWLRVLRDAGALDRSGTSSSLQLGGDGKAWRDVAVNVELTGAAGTWQLGYLGTIAGPVGQAPTRADQSILDAINAVSALPAK